MFNLYGVSTGENEEVLEMAGTDGCLMPLNCTLKKELKWYILCYVHFITIKNCSFP